MQPRPTRIPEILANHEDTVLKEWMSVQTSGTGRKLTASDERQLHANGREFLAALRVAMQSGTVTDVEKTEWTQARDFLSSFSGSRAKAGFSPAQTATFVFSLKEPLFSQLRKDVSDGQALADEIWNVSLFLDQLALFTTEVYQKSREEVILRQQTELLELSTPVVRLWDNVLALPLIGTLDSARTQVVMQNLLQAIVDTRSVIAIIDITGVPTVDTLVAQHLLKTVAAARLMGADCIISGIRPQIAQTIIHLGVNLEDVTTKATLADAFAVALKKTGYSLVKRDSGER